MPVKKKKWRNKNFAIVDGEEQYYVRFWIRNDDGFVEQKTELVKIPNGCKADSPKADKIVIDKYRAIGKTIRIISVSYC